MSKSDEWKNYSIEELEKQKVHEEIRQLAKPFYLKPSFLSIISSSIFAALTIYFTIKISNDEALKELDQRELGIQTTKLQIKQERLKESVSKFEAKEKYFKDSLTIKFRTDLLKLEYKLKEISLYIDDYRKSYANGRLSNQIVKSRISEYVKPDQEKEFRRWFYIELNRAIDLSNKRSLKQIELEKKISEYKID